MVAAAAARCARRHTEPAGWWASSLLCRGAHCGCVQSAQNTPSQPQQRSSTGMLLLMGGPMIALSQPQCAPAYWCTHAGHCIAVAIGPAAWPAALCRRRRRRLVPHHCDRLCLTSDETSCKLARERGLEQSGDAAFCCCLAQVAVLTELQRARIRAQFACLHSLSTILHSNPAPRTHRLGSHVVTCIHCCGGLIQLAGS